MKILDLRILPPVAVGRLGEAATPMEAFDLQISPDKPLDFRHIDPKLTFEVDSETGAILDTYTPDKIIFKEAHTINSKEGRARPVAPFLEVFAITDEDPDILVPLTLKLLEKAGLSMDNISWKVDLANIKQYRRTQNPKDKITAKIKGIKTHKRIAVEGKCPYFINGKTLPLGHVQFIKPTENFPEIRFRYTPGPGYVYGTKKKRIPSQGAKPVYDPVYEASINKYDFLLYSEKGDWFGYKEGTGKGSQKWPILTNPGFIFAGYDAQEKGRDIRVSWGYIDDECDGYAQVQLELKDGSKLKARAHIGAGPPAYAPDTLPIRVVSDEMEQILLGPDVDKEVPIDEAEDIVRRALETIRLMNTAIMNGNPFQGRPRVASTMVLQDANDFGRMFEPIMATSIVDNLAVRALHERIFNGIGSGASPWFESAMRRPDEIGKLSNSERRKMPALMRGADGRALCLTHRQINTIIKAAANAMFQKGAKALKPPTNGLIKVKDLHAQIHYRGNGNPFSVLPRTAISNCFPGLEFDFRNLWRRAFKEITLIENNNLVLSGKGLKDHRLVGIDIGEGPVPTTVVTKGPTFPDSGNSILVTSSNPNAVSFMEWSNNLASVLQHQGKQVNCYFTRKKSAAEVVYTAKQLLEEKEKVRKKDPSRTVKIAKLTVNEFFKPNSAALTDDILKPGELTQGLCAPWQNDYRECACYYWAASRPDYVNVEPDENGLSAGDNWMAKARTGSYIPDDRTDSRLVTYDDLFKNWQGELNFIVRGRDSLDSKGDTK